LLGNQDELAKQIVAIGKPTVVLLLHVARGTFFDTISIAEFSGNCN